MTRRSSNFLAALLLPTLVIVACGGETGKAPAPGPRPEVTAADGAFREPRRDGAAVFEVSGLGPGESAFGTVRVRNAGDESGLFSLTRAGLSDRPGPNGGKLSERLELAVLDVSRPGEPAVVYTGGVGPLGVRPLGVLRPGAMRTYSVRATVLTGQTPTVPLGGGDPYEGSTTRISLRWQAVAGLPPARATALLRRRREDREPPRLRFTAAPRQSVIRTGRLVASIRCTEPCRPSATARLPRGEALVRVARERGGREARLVVRFSSSERDALEEALGEGRTVPIRLRVEATDLLGNRRTLRETLRLRPRP